MHLPQGPGSFVEFRREDTEQSVPERFEQQASRFPDRIAVKTPDQLLTYHTLNQPANRIARAILAARRELYDQARQRHPARWSGNTRNWSHIDVVALNPERDEVVSSAAGAPHTQLKAA